VHTKSVIASIRVKRVILRLVDEMIGYGLASSRNEAINILIQMGMSLVGKEVEKRKRIHKYIELFEKQGGIILDKKTDVSREIRELRD